MISSKDYFESEVLSMIHRDGIEVLMDYINTTDFFEAPASSRFHGNHEGGLVEHSIKVYQWMFDIYKGLTAVKADIPKMSIESMSIVSLFHDVCKIETYKIDYRNVKDPDTGVWNRCPYYKQEDESGFGAHGAKSVFILNQFIKLTEEETVAILHHMGAWDKSTYSDPGRAYEKYRLAWLLHVADEAATYISKT